MGPIHLWWILPVFLVLVRCSSVPEKPGTSEGAAEAWAAHRASIAQTPLEEFRVDRSNVISGTVFSGAGLPLEGVRVEVFSKLHLLSSSVARRRSAPEAVTLTDAHGEFQVEGLPYGSKYLRATMQGHCWSVIEDVLSLDGVGAQELSTVLTEADPWTVDFDSEDGGTLQRLPARIIPEGLLGEESQAETKEGGVLALPAEHPGQGESGVWVLLGSPACVLQLDRTIEQVRVPGRADLRILLEGQVADEPATIALAPHASRTRGAATYSFGAGQPLVVPGIWCQAYEVTVTQGDRTAFASIQHDGEEVRLCLHPRWSTEISFIDEQGIGLGRAVRWRWHPDAPGELSHARADVRILLDTFGLHSRAGETAPGEVLRLEGLPTTGGVLEAWAPNHGHVHHALASDATQEVPVPRGVEVSIRTHLPYLPILVHSDGWQATFEADRFGEVQFVVPPGPYLVRSRFSRGRGSRFRGAWAGVPSAPVEFNLGDLVDPRSSAVFGFVTRGGRPVEGASVALTGPQPARVATDASGFYYFVDAPLGVAQVSAAPAGDPDGVHWFQPTEVTVGSDSRVDIEIPGGSAAFLGCFHELEGEVVSLAQTTSVTLPEGGEELARLVRRINVVREGSVMFTCLRPGEYELLHEEETLRRFQVAEEEAFLEESE